MGEEIVGVSHDAPTEQGTLLRSALKGPTLQDVANAAGVTIGTASKAINGRGKLSQETRERVRNEARRL
ncbi:MAG TPA: LacI family DNA-binding transcriptional regulator, partial [Ktedonobacteraceae bacterium]|nr:LacI family DNA-binding transcriptional regulator [Ktedonobacteraceae bacterium]